MASELPTIVWGRARGELLVQDPVDKTWFALDAKDAPRGWARIAMQAKNQRPSSVRAVPDSQYMLGKTERTKPPSVAMPLLVVMPHWSATRFMLYEQCPALFKERYVDGVALEPSLPLVFGKSFHQGLEEHYNGGDGERAFRLAWKLGCETELGCKPDPTLTATGLGLMTQVMALDLEGVPERGFSIDTNAELGAPIVGAIDLYDAKKNVVFDFKTTRGSWSQERAQLEVYQPLLYTQAIWDETGDWPSFEYIVCNRWTGAVDRYRRQWTAEEYLEQAEACRARMLEIATRVRAGLLECNGNHGKCLECSERWTHEHVCAQDRARMRVHR